MYLGRGHAQGFDSNRSTHASQLPSQSFYHQPTDLALRLVLLERLVELDELGVLHRKSRIGWILSTAAPVPGIIERSTGGGYESPVRGRRKHRLVDPAGSIALSIESLQYAAPISTSTSYAPRLHRCVSDGCDFVMWCRSPLLPYPDEHQHPESSASRSIQIYINPVVLSTILL